MNPTDPPAVPLPLTRYAGELTLFSAPQYPTYCFYSSAGIETKLINFFLSYVLWSCTLLRHQIANYLTYVLWSELIVYALCPMLKMARAPSQRFCNALRMLWDSNEGNRKTQRKQANTSFLQRGNCICMRLFTINMNHSTIEQRVIVLQTIMCCAP